MKDYEKEIANHEQAIAELKGEQEAFQSLGPDEQLAIALHDSLCRWNHTDGCTWFYEVHKSGVVDWDGYAHARWLASAKRVRATLPATMNNNAIVAVANAMEGLG